MNYHRHLQTNRFELKLYVQPRYFKCNFLGALIEYGHTVAFRLTLDEGQAKTAKSRFPGMKYATMPPELVKAHQVLDRAVDASYGKTPLKIEAERVSFLFERYQRLIAPLAVVEKAGKKGKRK